MQAQADRLYALDALRLVAALSVLLHHWIRVTPDEVKALLVYPEAFSWHGGFFGVATFFMISGLVILMSAHFCTAREFIFARAVRLYPGFWICCTITWLVCWNSPGALDRSEYAVNLTMFPAAVGARAVDSVYWTLATEAKFYALIAFLLATHRMPRLEPVLWVWLGSSATIELWRVRELLALDWAPFFVVGCACYLLREDRRYWRHWALFSAASVMAINVAVDRAGLHAQLYKIPNDWLAASCVAAAMILLVLSTALGWVRLPRGRALITAGAMSYPLYLVHKEIGWSFLRQWQELPGVPLFGAALAGMLALAWGVARLESVGQRVLRRFLNRNVERGSGGAARSTGLFCRPTKAVRLPPSQR